METPDLTGYRLVHRGMRTSSKRLAAVLGDLTEAERSGRAAKLVTWYAGFETELHQHHTLEDDVFFPSLFERVPSLRSYLQRIDDEHEHLVELLGSVRFALDGLADPAHPFDEALAGAATLATELESVIDGHLDFEDHEILPLFERHYDAAEYKALEDGAIHGGKPDIGKLSWTVPWMMTEATPDERHRMMDGAPFMLKALWVAKRGRYAKLERAAFGDVAAPALVTAGVA